MRNWIRDRLPDRGSAVEYYFIVFLVAFIVVGLVWYFGNKELVQTFFNRPLSEVTLGDLTAVLFLILLFTRR